MNIYDFDNTIINGDSSYKFIKYSLFRHPLLVTKSLFKALGQKLIGKEFKYVKGALFSFAGKIDNLDEYVENFVIKNQKHIKRFYLEQKKDDDVVISATCEFIVKPFCEKLGIKNVIGTKYDLKKGSIIGENCKGEEKVKRFNELFSNVKVNEAYSDSLSDIPMLKLARKAFLVKKDTVIEYKK